MKHKFGMIEVVFDILYLSTALVIGISLFFTGAAGSVRGLAGITALVLAGGDAFHLVPRIARILSGDNERFKRSLALGKLVTSITMTVFYALLWHMGGLLFTAPSPGVWNWIIGCLVLVRIILCLMPQNGWLSDKPPLRWAIIRNLPFLLIGIITAIFYGIFTVALPSVQWVWLAILLSFVFYLPVVLWAGINPKVGMLMLPKTCVYLWMLVMFLSL